MILEGECMAWVSLFLFAMVNMLKKQNGLNFAFVKQQWIALMCGSKLSLLFIMRHFKLLPWMEVGFSPIWGVFDVLMTIYFILYAYSWR